MAIYRTKGMFRTKIKPPASPGSTVGKNRKKIVHEGVFELGLIAGFGRFNTPVSETRRV